jgi:hypothetical protein
MGRGSLMGLLAGEESCREKASMKLRRKRWARPCAYGTCGGILKVFMEVCMCRCACVYVRVCACCMCHVACACA